MGDMVVGDSPEDTRLITHCLEQAAMESGGWLRVCRGFRDCPDPRISTEAVRTGSCKTCRFIVVPPLDEWGRA